MRSFLNYSECNEMRENEIKIATSGIKRKSSQIGKIINEKVIKCALIAFLRRKNCFDL